MKRILALLLFTLFFTPVAYASHSWGGYHWARTANPFTLKAGDNLTSLWKPYLVTAAADWSVSDILNMSVVPGQSKGNCRATAGQDEVCNKAYGNNGWLGVAQIWVSGSHITQGTTKVNDTYFNTSTYNTSAWRQMVMCQEVGHTLGLDHQDVNFTNPNLNTCMDYTNSPDSNQHPNAHDYDELDSIYAHLDSLTTVGQTIARISQGEGEEWGQLVRQQGKLAVFERDFGGSNKQYTFVIFAQ